MLQFRICATGYAQLVIGREQVRAEVFPVAQQALAIALIAAMLAGVYPAIRLGRMVIAQAIREE